MSLPFGMDSLSGGSPQAASGRLCLPFLFTGDALEHFQVENDLIVLVFWARNLVSVGICHGWAWFLSMTEAAGDHAPGGGAGL